MTTRRPLEPLSPRSHKVAPATMTDALDDISLTSKDAEDELDRRMLQQLRDERRLNSLHARDGHVQAFRKARTRPRVSVTLENLERHNAGISNGTTSGAHVQFQSPPSSSGGSAPSDPAVQPPTTWGRKARTTRHWMRTITTDDETTPPPRTEHLHAEPDADAPHPSVEDSPLSYKSPRHSTPAPPRSPMGSDEWDLDLNNASLIASTPYMPRSTVLDDIRQREIESLREQAVTTNRLDKMRQSSPITVYKKSTETVGIVDPGLLANAHTGSKRPAHRRDDSHDLLRRLARVSSTTPSPGRTTTAHPQKPPGRSSEALGSERRSTTPRVNAPSPPMESEKDVYRPEAPAEASEPQSFTDDKTPLPLERSILNPKTPVVTGAWIDTPRQGTAPRPKEHHAFPPQTLKGESTSQSVDKPQPANLTNSEERQTKAASPVRPSLPASVLQAVVEDARTNEGHHPPDFGDSTINSLEELIAPLTDDANANSPDEDTLQGLQVPTTTPKNEAERRRQQEALQLHRMNERLRIARTNIRDVSRGIKRVENRVEHAENGADGQPIGMISHECPCAIHGGHQCMEWTVWKGIKSLFYDERLKSRQKGWGLTVFSIVLLIFCAWFVLENTACEIWCHYEYASSYKGYGVTWNAPKYPFVIPTVLYRNFVKPWWQPLSGFAVFLSEALWGCFVGSEIASTPVITATAARFATKVLLQEEDDAVLGMGADDLVR